MILSKPPAPYRPDAVRARHRKQFVLRATLAALRSGATGSIAAADAATAAKTLETLTPDPWEVEP